MEFLKMEDDVSSADAIISLIIASLEQVRERIRIIEPDSKAVLILDEFIKSLKG